MSAAGPALRILSVGKTRRGPLRELEHDYLARIARHAKLQREEVAASRRRRAAERRKEEGAALIHRVSRAGLTIALDAGGREVSSASFRQDLMRWWAQGELTWIVGGPDGLDEELILCCQQTLSLGRITLPHELALVVLLEQIYRALAANAGHPYAKH